LLVFAAGTKVAETKVEHHKAWKSDRVDVMYRRNGEERRGVVVRQNADAAAE
jgi:hypothetical protein